VQDSCPACQARLVVVQALIRARSQLSLGVAWLKVPGGSPIGWEEGFEGEF
jgi:hypothetical protein